MNIIFIILLFNITALPVTYHLRYEEKEDDSYDMLKSIIVLSIYITQIF